MSSRGSILATVADSAPAERPVGDPTAGPMNVITTVAGTDSLFTGDGKPAQGASLSEGVFDVEISPEAEVHFADLGNRAVMKVRSDGTLEVVAGNGARAPSGLDTEPVSPACDRGRGAVQSSC